MQKVIFIIEKTSTGFSAYAENYNAATAGDTIEQIKENALESINLLLEYEGKPLATTEDIEFKFETEEL